MKENFWVILLDMFNYLKKVNDALLICERDSCNAIACFNVLKMVEDYISELEISNSLYIGIKYIQIELFKHLNKKILNLGHYLDFENTGKLLSTDETKEVKEYLFSTSIHRQEILIEMYKYENKTMNDFNSILQNNNECGIKSSAILWNYNKIYFPNLFIMFERLCTIAVSSCIVERSFSIQGIIKNKNRLKLKNINLYYLMNIKYNSFVMNSKEIIEDIFLWNDDDTNNLVDFITCNNVDIFYFVLYLLLFFPCLLILFLSFLF